MSDQQPDKVIDVPGVGSVAFPPSMTDAQINAAATKLYQGANPGKKQPPKTSWVDTAVDWLPAVGGAVGGALGASTGAVTFGLSGVPGAVAIGAVGGAAGEALKQTINRKRGAEAPQTSGDAALRVLKEGGIQGAIEGVTGGVASLARGVAPAVMRTALGNTDAVLSRAPDVAKVALKTGATVTRSGFHKLDDILATKALGIADRAAIEATRDAVAAAWKRLSADQVKTLFGATAGNPAFRSLMAQGLYHVAAPLAKVSAQAIRVALGVATTAEANQARTP